VTSYDILLPPWHGLAIVWCVEWFARNETAVGI